MPKARFTVMDCVRMCAEVNAALAGAWVQNIYTSDDDAKTFFFKLTGKGDKAMLLIESGVRFHPTEFVREKSEMPSGFAMKLRKHVRERKLTKVFQLGLDRVVVFTFEKGTDIHHVVLEMYAGGNVILTDGAGLILTLLRPYTVEEGRVAVGQVYPLQSTPDPTVDASLLHAYLAEAAAKFDAASSDSDEESASGAEEGGGEGGTKPKRKPTTVKGQVEAPRPTRRSKGKAKKLRDKEKMHLRELAQVLTAKGSPAQAYGPALVAHCLATAGLDPEKHVTPGTADESDAIAAALAQAANVLAELRDGSKALPGVVTVLENGVYDGYDPIHFAHAPATGAPREFPSFHAAVDEYYSKVETHRQLKEAAQAERAALAKVEGVKQQQQQRVDDLQRTVAQRERAAEALAQHAVEADQAMAAVNSLLASGMAWPDVEAVVQREKQAGNPVAQLVRALRLKDHQATLCFDDVLVDVDLRLSAQANVSSTFSEKKRASKKVEVTAAKAKQVVEEMAGKVAQDLKKRVPTQGVVMQRKPMWFERFHWFLTSEGVLVLGGKDAHQNEALVKRFLRQGDVFLHADIHGAPTCIVRNPFAANPIPPESLRQAGMFCVCRSSAWNAKVITSAWWVNKDQVSKTAQAGEFLPTGSFVVRGKKNYLQPARLEMGFGYIFKVDTTASEAKRAKEWRYLHDPQGGALDEDESAQPGDPDEEADEEEREKDWKAQARKSASSEPEGEDEKGDADKSAEAAGAGAAAAAAAEEEEDDDEAGALVGGEDVLLGFTAAPVSDDVLLYALPFCGPMASMAHFKFRVKLTPGTTKKGKASKQAVELFDKTASRRERELMVAVTDPQNVAVMMGEVKVSAPGLEKVKAAKRASASRRRKEEEERGGSRA